MKLGEHFPNSKAAYFFARNSKRLTEHFCKSRTPMQLPDIILYYLDYFDLMLEFTAEVEIALTSCKYKTYNSAIEFNILKRYSLSGS